MSIRRRFMLAVLAAAWVVQAGAESKALLVGISEFPQQDLSLPAVAADLESMRLAAAHLGIKPQNVKVLQNSGATAPRIKAALHGWSALDLGAEDHLLVYFSTFAFSGNGGPGLLTYNADAPLSLEDVFRRLAALRAGRVYLILDVAAAAAEILPSALHTAARGADNTLVMYPAGGGYVKVLDTAAAARGSPMTLAVTDALNKARQGCRKVDFAWLHAAVKQRAGAAAGVAAGGAAELAALPLPLVYTAQARPTPQKDFFTRLLSAARDLTMQAPAEYLRVGEQLSLVLQIPREGYLNIFSVNANDQTVALFPNRLHRDNFVRAGDFRLPTREMGFAIQAQAPLGETLVAAFLTRQAIDSYALEAADDDEVESTFTGISGVTMQALRAMSEARFDTDYLGAGLLIEIGDGG